MAGRAAVGAGRSRLAGGAAAEWGGERGGTSAAHLATGLRGEEEALFHLRRQGYTIVARRWTQPEGAWGCGSDWVAGGVAVLYRGEGADGKGPGAGGVRGGWGEAGDAAAAGAGVSEGDCGGAEARDSGAVRRGFGLFCVGWGGQGRGGGGASGGVSEERGAAVSGRDGAKRF